MGKIGLFFSIIIVLIYPFIGSLPLSFELLHDTTQQMVLWQFRLPREFLAFVSGSILALSGLVYQSLFRNPLLTPYTLGISSASVLFVGLGIVTGSESLHLFGFIGAIGSVAVVLLFSRIINTTSTTMLLLGIALSFFYNAALMLLFYLGDSISNDILLRFSMGSLSVVGWENVLLSSVVAFCFLFVVWIFRYELHFLALNQELAQQRGVGVQRVFYTLLVSSSIAIATIVSVTGPIGFVGLIIPHIVQKVFGVNVKQSIVLTFFFGGIFLLFCDLVSKILQSSNELPIGIITALFGALFFIYLILQKKDKL